MTGAPPGNTGCRSIAGRLGGDAQVLERTSHGPEPGVLSGQSPGAALAEGSSPRKPSWGRRHTCPGSEGRRGGLKPLGRAPVSTVSQHTPGAPVDEEAGAPATADLPEEYSLLFQSLHLWGLFCFVLF